MQRQKYIGEIKHYEVDDWFVDKIRELDPKLGIQIATQVDRVVEQLPSQEHWTQEIAGVSNALSSPYFFKVEYIREHGEPPIFLDIQPIDVDEYLDYYNEKKTIKLNEETYNNTSELS
jgi:hypothetical protein